MKKISQKLIFLASFLLISFWGIKNVSAENVDAIKMEIQRYDGVNPNTFWIIGFLILTSYSMGWVTTKIKNIDAKKS